MSDNLAHQLGNSGGPSRKSWGTTGLRGLAGATTAIGGLSPQSRTGRIVRVAGRTIDKVANKIDSQNGNFPLAQAGAIARAKAGARNLGGTIGAIRQAANASIISSGGLKDESSQATTLQRQQAAARQREKMIREGYWQEDEPAIDDERYQIDWGGAGEDTNANLFSESGSQGSTAEADQQKKKIDRFNIFSDLEEEAEEEAAAETAPEGMPGQTPSSLGGRSDIMEKSMLAAGAGAGAAAEAGLDRKTKKEKTPDEASKDEQKGKDQEATPSKKGEEKSEADEKEAGKKQKGSDDLKPQPLPADTEEESKKAADDQKKKEEAKQKQTTEQRIKNSQNQAKNNLKNAAKSAASLKVSDAQAAVELAAKQGSAALLTSMWGAVWLDWTGLTLLGLNIYLAASLFIDKLAQFGEDYLFGRWLGKELGKWVEIIILAIIDFFILSVIFFIFYMIYRIWERGAWNILDFIWGTIKGTGGTAEIIKKAAGQ